MNSVFFRQVLTMVSGNTAAQFIGILIIPVITRIFTPDEIGQYAVFISIYAVLSTIVTGRFEYSILLPKRNRQAFDLFRLSLLSALSILTILFVIVAFFEEQIALLFGIAGNSNWLYLLPLAVFIHIFFLVLTFWQNRHQNYTSIAIGKGLQTSTMGASQIGLGLMSFGTVGLIAGKIVGDTISMLYLWHQRKVLDEAERFGINKKRLIVLAKKYQDFPKFNAPQAFTNALSSNLPIFIFSRFFGESLTGLYAMAYRATFLPIQLVAAAFYQVFSRKISELYQSDADVHSFYKKTSMYLFIFAAFPFGTLFLVSPHLFPVILGSDWAVTGTIVQYLTPWMYIAFIGSAFSFIPLMLNQQRKALIIELTYLLLRVIAFAIGVYLHDFYLAITLFVASGVIVVSYQLWWYNNILKSSGSSIKSTYT